jgi:hypothetical protein
VPGRSPSACGCVSACHVAIILRAETVEIR